jgi:hypothetical protein
MTTLFKITKRMKEVTHLQGGVGSKKKSQTRKINQSG